MFAAYVPDETKGDDDDDDEKKYNSNLEIEKYLLRSRGISTKRAKYPFRNSRIFL